MLSKEAIYNSYSKIYADITQNDRVELKQCHTNDVLIDKFIALILKENSNQTIHYAESIIRFNLSYRIEDTVKFGGKIMPSWILGAAAIKRYAEAHPYHKEQVRLKADRIKQKNLKPKLLRPSEFEEDNKRKFFDTQYRLLWCCEMTTLFHPLSEWCNKCKMQKECKQIQKQNYSQIAKIRQA